jgi:hypothetical protein
MEVQLRPSRSRFHPLVRPSSRRYGIGYTQPPDCTPTIPGAIPNPGCIAEQARIQQLNMAEHDEGQRQIFLDNCNRDWALNDAQYAALRLPRPVNQCDQIYSASGRGAADPVQLAPAYMVPAPAPASVSAPAPSPAPITATPAPITKPDIGAPPVAPSPVTTTADTTFFTNPVDIAGSSIPMWVILAAAVGLYFAMRGK